jgi:prepilin-type N-terminal cleavage/methylation domain-containing protein
MKLIKRLTAFTLIELLVVITIIGILATIAIPAIGGAVDKAKLTQAQTGLAGIAKAVALVSVDVNAYGDTNIAIYPGTNLAFWYNTLTNYVSTSDLMKIFSAGDVKVSSWSASTGPNTNAFYIYGVSDESADDTLFFTSRNWLAPTSGNGPALTKSARPFGDKGVIVLKKGGSASVLSAMQATNAITNIGITTNCLNP